MAKKLLILHTGGTISMKEGENGKVSPSARNPLLDALERLNHPAELHQESVFNVPSPHITLDHWLVLKDRIEQAVNEEHFDGIVITHGTDTMEETAYFLNLTVHSKKPVVMVGAMRPANSMSADGALNLYNAVAVAADKNAMARGVLVCMNDVVIGAKDVIKTNTTAVETFQAANYGNLAYIHNGKAYFNRTPEEKHTYQSIFNVDNLKELPKVGIVYSYANASELPMQAFIDAKYDGIVHAGVGNGNFYKANFDLAVKARKEGIQIVRSSRVPTGATTTDAEVDDSEYEFIASQTLNPQKARVLLMLALTKTKDWKTIQKYFDEY